MIHKNEKGFTLIELLVVIAIIGILAAIAIPQFAAYRNNAFCSRVESDVTNAMIAGEAFYAENEAYPTGAASTANGGFQPSDQVTVAYSGLGTTASPFTVTGTDGSGVCPKGGTYTFTQGTAPLWS
jgi:prepilin-type N-terminal cleavage/methylation domain-containing protein